jgi:hypothetical protein
MPDPEETPPSYQAEPWQAEVMRQAGEKPEPWAVSLFDTIFRAFTFAFRLVWDDFFKRIILRVLDLFKQGFVLLQDQEDAAWAVFVQFLQENKMLTDKQVDMMIRMKGMPLGINSAVNFYIMLSWIKGYMDTLYAAASSETREKAFAEFRPTLLDTNAAIQNAFLDPTKTTKVKEILARHGLKDEYIEMLFLNAYSLHSESTLRDLMYKGEKSEADVLAALNQRGYTDTRAKEILSVWKYIPGVIDLLRLGSGNAFDAALVDKYKLTGNMPGELLEWGQKQGVPEDWLKKFWVIQHWNPTPAMALEMLHRGLIKQEEVNDVFDFGNVPDFWRDKLTSLSYQQYSRIDIRRMHKAGTLKDSDLVPSFKALGFDDEKAGVMAAFTIQYNNSSYRDLGQTQIVKAYRDSMISRDDAHDLLIALNYDEPTVEWILSMADWEEQLEIQTLYVSSIQENYKAARIGENDARAALMKLNLPGARIDALIEKWKPTRITETKMVSKTDLDKMFRAKVIDADTYKAEMYKLGYSWQYTSWYYSLLTGGKA